MVGVVRRPRPRRPGSTRRAPRASRTDEAPRARAPPPGRHVCLGAQRRRRPRPGSSSSRRPTLPPAGRGRLDPGSLGRRDPRSALSSLDPSDEPRLGQRRSHVAEPDHDGTVGLTGVDAPLELEQVVEDSGGRRVSIARVLPQQPPHDLVEGPRRCDACLADAAWSLQHLCAEELADVRRVVDRAGP